MSRTKNRKGGHSGLAAQFSKDSSVIHVVLDILLILYILILREAGGGGMTLLNLVREFIFHWGSQRKTKGEK